MSAKPAEPGMVELDDERATVIFDRRYEQPISAVWRALTDAGLVSQWLDSATIELRVGGSFEVHFSDGTMVGHITELVPERVLAYSWNEDQNDASNVRWELIDDGTATKLRLTHTKLARRSATAYAGGWHQHLDMLADVLAGVTAEWQDERFAELVQTYEATGPRR